MPNSDEAIRKALGPKSTLGDLCRHVSGKAPRSPVRRAAVKTVAVRPDTYKAARQKLLAQFKRAGWDVREDAKIPYATSFRSRLGCIRFWLKPQSISATVGQKHVHSQARPTKIDPRSPQAFEKMEALARVFHGMRKNAPLPATDDAADKAAAKAKAPSPPAAPVSKPAQRFTLKASGKKEPWDYSSLEREMALSVARSLKAEGRTVTVRDNKTGEIIFGSEPAKKAKPESSADFARGILADLRTIGPRSQGAQIPMLSVFQLYRKRGGSRNIMEFEEALLQAGKRGDIKVSKKSGEIFVLNPRVKAEPSASIDYGPGKPGPFSRNVLRDVKAIPASGRFGPRNVFISEAFKLYKRRSGPMNLYEFKRALVLANQRGDLNLVRADLVGAMDPKLVNDSETQHLNATFHFIVDPTK